MINIKVLYLFLFNFFIFFACQQKNSEMNDLRNTFQQKGIVEKIQNKLSEKNDVLELFSIKEMKIKTNNEEIINTLQILCKTDFLGNMYFLSIASEIYKVSPTGKLIKKFHSIGRGPGEYLGLLDICIDKKLNIYVLDTKQKLIIKYNKSFEYLFSFNYGKYNISKLQLNDAGNLIAFIPLAELNPLVEFNSNTGEIIKEYGQPEPKTKEYGFAHYRAGSMFISNKNIHYIFPLSYQLYITDSKDTTNVVTYPALHFPEVKEIILLSRIKKNYKVIYKMFQLNEEVLLLNMVSYINSEKRKRSHCFEIVSVYGDIIKEKISPNDPIRIYGQIEPGKLISIVNRESTNDKIDTYIRILDFNL